MVAPIPPTPKKFLTNQGENTLSGRLEKILPLTQDFDCLVGYFFISGFFRLYPALESIRKVRILIGLKNEQVVHGLIQIARDGAGEGAPSVSEVKATFGGMLRKELVQAEDTLAIETGVRKFIEWIRSGKLEVKLYREQNIHAKVYILTPEHPVVFIADVVGLGKTFMSALLALQLDGRCLVIAPPSLLDENSPGSWARVFRDFCVPGHKCASIGKLEEVIEQGVEFYKYVIIDESHRFKGDYTQRYEHLTRICQGKGVILVSATPYNNSPDDIYSQLKLFTLPGSVTSVSELCALCGSCLG